MRRRNYGPSIGSQMTLKGIAAEHGGKSYSWPNGDDLAALHASQKTSGIFAGSDWAASIREIPDGTSKTIAMGEVLPVNPN